MSSFASLPPSPACWQSGGGGLYDLLPPFAAQGSPGAPPDQVAGAITIARRADGSRSVEIAGPSPRSAVVPPQCVASASPFARLELADAEDRLVAASFVAGRPWSADLRFCESDSVSCERLLHEAAVHLSGGPDAAAAVLAALGIDASSPRREIPWLDLLAAYDRARGALGEEERQFLWEALDFVRWRSAGIESHGAWLSGFADDVRRRADEDGAFLASLPCIVCDDLSATGRNAMALYAVGLLTIDDLRRYFAAMPREISERCAWDGGVEGGVWRAVPRVVGDLWCGAYDQRGWASWKSARRAAGS